MSSMSCKFLPCFFHVSYYLECPHWGDVFPWWHFPLGTKFPFFKNEVSPKRYALERNLSSRKKFAFLEVNISLKLNILRGTSSRGRKFPSWRWRLPRDEASWGNIPMRTMWFRGAVVSLEINFLPGDIKMSTTKELYCLQRESFPEG